MNGRSSSKTSVKRKHVLRVDLPPKRNNDQSNDGRDKNSAEVLEEITTNFPNFFAALVYFIWSNTRTILITIFSNWTLLFRHPISTLLRLIFVPVVAVAMLALCSVLFIGKIFKLDVLLQKVSSRAYDGRSIANWGDTDAMKDPDIESGLLLTSGTSGLPSKFNAKVAKAMLFFSSIVYEDEGTFDEVLEWHTTQWVHLQLLNHPGRIYSKIQQASIGNFAALFKIFNESTGETAIILSFRGTSPLDLNQWLIDCSTNKVDAHDYLFGAAHEGFYRTLFRKRRTSPINFYQRLVLEIETLVASENLGSDNRPCRLWVTGHSLGASLASLFFARVSKTREIKGITLCDAYSFGSPHVGNLDFRSNYNAPFYNSSRLYRVFNLNDPIARIPFGFDDPNVLAMSKGPSGLDPIDYCHFGVPILLHQHTLNLPNEYPDFIIETPQDLVMYWYLSLVVDSHVGNFVEWILSWITVYKSFLTFSRKFDFISGARLVVNFLETSVLMINHSPSTYCRNLTIKEDHNL